MEPIGRRQFIATHLLLPACAGAAGGIVSSIVATFVQELLADRHHLALELIQDPMLTGMLMPDNRLIPGYVLRLGIRNDGDFPEEDLVAQLSISAPPVQVTPMQPPRFIILVIRPPSLVAEPDLMLEGSSLMQVHTAPASQSFIARIPRMNPGEWLGISFMANVMPSVVARVRTRDFTVTETWPPLAIAATPIPEGLDRIMSQQATFEAQQATFEAAQSGLNGTPVVTPP